MTTPPDPIAESTDQLADQHEPLSEPYGTMGEMIRHGLCIRGMTVRGFAKRVGVHEWVMHSIIEGRQEFPRYMYDDAVKAFGFSTEFWYHAARETKAQAQEDQRSVVKAAMQHETLWGYTLNGSSRGVCKLPYYAYSRAAPLLFSQKSYRHLHWSTPGDEESVECVEWVLFRSEGEARYALEQHHLAALRSLEDHSQSYVQQCTRAINDGITLDSAVQAKYQKSVRQQAEYAYIRALAQLEKAAVALDTTKETP